MDPQGWRPIESLTEHERALLFCPYAHGSTERDPVIAVGYYDSGHYHPWRVDDGRKMPKLWALPSHWQPLPPPPNQDT